PSFDVGSVGSRACAGAGRAVAPSRSIGASQRRIRLMVSIQRMRRCLLAGPAFFRAVAGAIISGGAIVVFFFLLLMLAAAADAAALQDELPDETEQGNHRAKPVEHGSLLAGPCDRVELFHFVSQTQSTIREQERADETCQRHGPKSEKQ